MTCEKLEGLRKELTCFLDDFEVLCIYLKDKDPLLKLRVDWHLKTLKDIIEKHLEEGKTLSWEQKPHPKNQYLPKRHRNPYL